MDDALVVRISQGIEQFDADGGHVAVAEPVAGAVERLAADELPDQHRALVVREPVVEGDDVGVVERRGRLDLPRDARRQRAPVGDDLERDGLLLNEVVGLEHLRERAAADPADQLVAVAPISEIWGRALRGDGHSGARFDLGSFDIRCGTMPSLSEPVGEWRNWQTR